MGEDILGIIPTPHLSYLDHLAPLCHVLKIPLFTNDSWIAICAQHFYPQLEVIQGDSAVLSEQRTFCTVEPSRLHPSAIQFGAEVVQTQHQTIAGFHGNPAKFQEDFWIERYANEDVVLFYGPYLEHYFKEKNVWKRLKKTVRIGNIRLAYYKQFQSFFDQKVRPFLFEKQRRRTVFYAPTWSYPHFHLETCLFKNIPEDYQLLVKFHPYTHRLFPDRIQEVKERYSSDQIRFIDDIPLIYPILNQVDIFLGESSSIGFDFLAFNRPLFFFGEGLSGCGKTIEVDEKIYQVLDQSDMFSAQRREKYAYVYGEPVAFETIQKELKQ